MSVMNVVLPPLPAFSAPDARVADALIARVQQIDSFAAVAAWDREANAFVAYAKAFFVAVPDIETQISLVEQHAKVAHANRGFFERTFSPQPLAAEIHAMRKQLRAALSALAGLVEQLEALIDQTPDTPEEKKAMLFDLRALKKELTQQKKALNLAMREVRTNARRASAHAVGGIFTSARVQRMNIRFQKEAALKPHEDEKTALERRIMTVERIILWIERIK